MLHQRWDSITFIHWRFPPERIQRLLPQDLTVEEIDGSAWVGLTPFVAKGTRLHGPLPLRLASDFPETNCRTYVRTPAGDSAVWFFSLEAADPVIVLAARSLLGVPYRAASMTATRSGRRYKYTSRRCGRPDVGHRVEVDVGPRLPAEDVSGLERRLTARWRAVVPRGGNRLVVPVSHPPWELHTADIVSLEETLLDAAGLERPAEGPASVLWSPGVDSVLGLPQSA